MKTLEKFQTSLLNKYYAKAVDLCDTETPMVCYCGQLAKAAGEVW